MADGESDIEFPAEITMVRMQPIPPPRAHFFYEKPDGSIIDLGEQEAAIMQKNAWQKMQSWKMIGVSDGKASIAYLRGCGVRAREQVAYAKAQEIMRESFRLELEASRGHFRQPVYTAVEFGNNLAAQNADSIGRELPR